MPLWRCHRLVLSKDPQLVAMNAGNAIKHYVMSSSSLFDALSKDFNTWRCQFLAFYTVPTELNGVTRTLYTIRMFVTKYQREQTAGGVWRWCGGGPTSAMFGTQARRQSMFACQFISKLSTPFTLIFKVKDSNLMHLESSYVLKTMTRQILQWPNNTGSRIWTFRGEGPRHTHFDGE